MPSLSFLSSATTSLVGVAHIGFFALESFMWRTKGVKLFRFDPNYATCTFDLAKNQGVYNLLLAAGCLWSVVRSGATEANTEIATFFNLAVCVAALAGGLTVDKAIAIKQGTPALIALASLAGLDNGSWLAAGAGAVAVALGSQLGPVWSTAAPMRAAGETIDVKFPSPKPTKP